MPQETVEIYDLLLRTETEKAYLIIYEGLEKWIPKSQVSYIEFGEKKAVPDDRMLKEIIRMEIPLWIAEEKGMA